MHAARISSFMPLLIALLSEDGKILAAVGIRSAASEVLGRFYRAADTNTGGAGLGLSIVKSIAQIHSARVELGESDLGGLAIRVRFQLI
jgi:K+-sensing histidine kinase KdpD